MRRAARFAASAALPLALLLLPGCLLDPPGDCSPVQPCPTGLTCAEGVCVGCTGDADCAAGRACTLASHRCDPIPGYCEDRTDCTTFEDCDDTHRCIASPRACRTADDCGAPGSCDLTTHRCRLPDGRCYDDTDCPELQHCDLLATTCVAGAQGDCNVEVACPDGLTCESHVCTGCTSNGTCAEGHTCEADRCVRNPGWCDARLLCTVDKDCDLATNTCVVPPDACDDAADCSAPRTCNTTIHRCRLPAGTCDVDADCDEWLHCDGGTGRCVLDPGRCLSLADCGAIASCDVPTHACTGGNTGTNAGIVLYGTLTPGLCGRETVAPLDAPTATRVGFNCHDDALLRPDGSVVYVTEPTGTPVRTEIRLWRPEPLVLAADRWSYPVDVHANDSLLHTCPAVNAAIVVQSGTGALAVRCGNDAWRNLAGEELLPSGDRFLAWAPDGHMLVVRDGVLTVVADGVATVVSEDRFLGYSNRVRVHGNTFLLPQGDGLYEVSPEAVLTEVGRYAARGPQDGGVRALGPTGAAYVFSHTDAGDDVVKRFDPDGSPPVVVYTEADAPAFANDLTHLPPVTFAMIHISDLLYPP